MTVRHVVLKLGHLTWVEYRVSSRLPLRVHKSPGRRSMNHDGPGSLFGLNQKFTSY